MKIITEDGQEVLLKRNGGNLVIIINDIPDVYSCMDQDFEFEIKISDIVKVLGE